MTYRRIVLIASLLLLGAATVPPAAARSAPAYLFRPFIRLADKNRKE